MKLHLESSSPFMKGHSFADQELSKRIMKKTIIIALIFVLSGCLNSYTERKKRFDDQIGTYQIDLNQTHLGGYNSDSLYFSQLKLSYFKDSTFLFNMKVPFIRDSFGVWSIGTDQLYQWNKMHYNENVNWGDQFYQYSDDDSTFAMNSVTPQKGYEPVPRIYFKKISSEPTLFQNF
ncbi:MAG: hypothetical protein ACWA41_09830 [Putridiphycobacter sp.]